AETRRHGTGRASRTNGTTSAECQQGKEDQKTRAGGEAAGVISNQWCRYNANRCHRGGNGGSGGQRIRLVLEPLRHRGGDRRRRYYGAGCAREMGSSDTQTTTTE